MNNPNYLYKSEKSLKIYEFISEGSKRTIHKMVEYSETGTENIYNLAFGDFNETTNAIDDSSITNNGDSIKVLATVASTVYAFTEKHPTQPNHPVRDVTYQTNSNDEMLVLVLLSKPYKKGDLDLEVARFLE
jgi:hypothetical protein